MCIFKKKTAYERRISDWSSDVCSSDLAKSDKGIPTQWRGMEASFPMLVDWIADAQFQAGKAAEEKNAQAAANKQLPTADGMKIFLSGLADQIRAGGYSERAFTSIAPLIDMEIGRAHV